MKKPNLLQLVLMISLFLGLSATKLWAEPSCGGKDGKASSCSCGDHGKMGKYHHPDHGMRDMDDNDPHGHLFLDYAKELNLTEDQVAKLNKIRSEAQEKAMKVAEERKQLWEEFNTLAHSDDASRSKIISKVEKMGDLKSEMMKIRIISMLDAKEVLTKEQQDKFKAIADKDKAAPPPAQKGKKEKKK